MEWIIFDYGLTQINTMDKQTKRTLIWAGVLLAIVFISVVGCLACTGMMMSVGLDSMEASQ
ncbi:MAG: hypothetical protein OXE77_00120 [Flavobacteriaceae bacterium]|nr:hypothetical protein [Flavobacteriaceae bacterium]MCY4267001.1 hypothetical protein [Flavobacteriaceae bacterium]